MLFFTISILIIAAIDCTLLSTKKYVDTKVRSTTSKGELAIVLQGIVAIQDDCTLETVRLYKKIFPSAIIILSTWDFTSDEPVAKIQRGRV